MLRHDFVRIFATCCNNSRMKTLKITDKAHFQLLITYETSDKSQDGIRLETTVKIK